MKTSVEKFSFWSSAILVPANSTVPKATRELSMQLLCWVLDRLYIQRAQTGLKKVTEHTKLLISESDLALSGVLLVTKQLLEERNFFMSLLILLCGDSRFVDSFKLCGQGSSYFCASTRGCGCSFMIILTHGNHQRLTLRMFTTFLCISADADGHFAIQPPSLQCQAAAYPYVGLGDTGTTTREYHYPHSCSPTVLWQNNCTFLLPWGHKYMHCPIWASLLFWILVQMKW